MTFTDPPVGIFAVAGTLAALLIMMTILGTIGVVTLNETLFERLSPKLSDVIVASLMFIVVISAAAGFYVVLQDAIAPVEISARDGTIIIRRGKQWSGRAKSWRYDDVAGARAESLGPSINLQMVGVLRIIPVRGFAVSLFQRRPMTELRWIARVLSKAMSKDQPAKYRSFRLS